MRRLSRRLKTFTLIALALTAAAVAAAVWDLERERPLSVVFFDVGQGDAIFIEAPNGNQMLVDGGPDGTVLRRLGEFLPLRDHALDVILATHPDKDHIGGLSYVLDRYDVAHVFHADIKNDTAASDAFDGAALRSGARQYLNKRNTVIDLGAGAFVLIRYPLGVSVSSDTNLSSAVVQVYYGTTSFLLTGDAPQDVERRLVALDGAALRSDVLKLGHHGSKTSSLALFIDTVHPDEAVVSAGLHNSYGHPHPDVIARLRERGIMVESTAEEGTIVFVSDGKHVTREY